MSDFSQSISMNDAASEFLANLPPGGSGTSQQEINKFIRWFGKDRTFDKLAAADVESYAEQLSFSDTDYLKKFGLLKNFLAYAKKNNWSATNLSTHLKAKKGKVKLGTVNVKNAPEPIPMTRQGYQELEDEISSLKAESRQVTEQMRKARADKDYKENAPLHAAREKKGHLEGKLLELEETLIAATIIEENQEIRSKVCIGDCVLLSDLKSGEELRYTVVSPREVDVIKGKISSASPIGQALIGKKCGDQIEIQAPVGKLTFQLKKIEN